MLLRQDDLAVQPAGDEVVLLCLRSSTYFSANAAGALLLDRLRDGGATEDELVATLVEAFDLDERTAAHDVEVFLADLADHDLLLGP